MNILNCAAWLRPSPADLHGNRAAVQVQVRIQVHPVPKGGFSLSPHFPGGVRPSIPQGVPGGGEGESGASVLRPLLLSVGGAWGLLGLGGLPAGLGARPVLALHVDAQPLGTGLLATGLAAAMQDLLH